MSAVFAATGFAAAGKPTPPTGDAQGLALLNRVHKAYLHVPAVVVSAHSGSVTLRFTLVLSSGVTTAEQAVVINGWFSKTVLVARKNSLTYARDPGTSCWRRVAASDSQSLEDVGIRFPNIYTMKVKRPSSTAAGWLLPVLAKGKFDKAAHTLVYTIARKTLQVKSVSMTSNGTRIVEYVTALKAAPKLPVPKPRC
jgi:hypothetical protein